MEELHGCNFAGIEACVRDFDKNKGWSQGGRRGGDGGEG